MLNEDSHKNRLIVISGCSGEGKSTLLAKELGSHIRVNAVAPGPIITPRTEDFSVAIEKFENRTPLKRTGTPNDISELVLAIIKSNYINGEIIVADGGFSLV